MFTPKITSLASVVTFLSGTLLLSACGTVSDVWDYASASGDDPSLRTPTGYYDHVSAKSHVDPLKVPSNLKAPLTDRNLEIPEYTPNENALALVGANMDIRPPVVAKLSNGVGVDILNVDETAVVWFLPYNQLSITSETQAWQFLLQSLSSMKIELDEVDEQKLELTTKVANFNAFGEPYDDVSADLGNIVYKQRYKIEVGHNAQGQVGYLISLLDSASFDEGDSTGYKLNTIQKRNFTVGLANSVVNTALHQLITKEYVPDDVQVVLGRDNNAQDVLIVHAPYNATWTVMLGLLRQYSFELDEYSVSSSQIKVSYSEEDADFYRNLGVESFGLASDNYIIRVGVLGDSKTSISFYSEKDIPLPASQVATLYPGFSKAIAKEFVKYKQEGSAYLTKFEE